MSWRPIDFQGMIDLDPKIVEQVEIYLQEKENRLAHRLLHILNGGSAEPSQPILPKSGAMKLSEAVEGFTKQVRGMAAKGGSPLKQKEESGRAAQEINRAFWQYTEILEGCVVELFQQVKQVPLDRWHISLSVVVQVLKENLLHRMEDLLWTLRRLEKPLNEYCGMGESKAKKWMAWISGKSRLDHRLLRNLQQTETFLKSKFSAFKDLYNEFLMLNIRAEESLEKMKSYPILALLDLPDQNVYVDVFRLLKMIELNPHPKKGCGP